MGEAVSLSGERPPGERKPTEAVLVKLIASYREVYAEQVRRAGAAAVRVVQESSPQQGVNWMSVQAAYVDELTPILPVLMGAVADAVRLGASRVWRRGEHAEVVDVIVLAATRRAADARERWLRKMARDYVGNVLMPMLGLPRPTRRALAGWDGAGQPRFVAVSPSDFNVGEPLKEFVFTQDQLDDLSARGARFGNVRVVEATEHDVWKGDDLGFIGAASAAGSDRFRWRTSPDDLVCPVCSALDGEEFSAAEAASISEDRGLYAHCRCRCWFETVDMGEEREGGEDEGPAGGVLLAPGLLLEVLGLRQRAKPQRPPKR